MVAGSSGEPPDVQNVMIFLSDKSILSINVLTTFGATAHQIGNTI